MGVVTHKVEHDWLDVSLMIDQRANGECRRSWEMITLDVGHIDRLTPKELRQLARWLQQEGNRIGREFKSNGARKDNL